MDSNPNTIMQIGGMVQTSPHSTSLGSLRMQEEELWTIFKKWGDVREIFISRQRNKGGRRYGFVRFKGVSDETRLERQLDNIIVGGLKMHVNIPKYGRGKATQGKSTNKHYADR